MLKYKGILKEAETEETETKAADSKSGKSQGN